MKYSEYEPYSWMLGDTLYYMPNKTSIAEIENIMYEILIDTTGVENNNYINDSILYMSYREDYIWDPDNVQKINYRIVYWIVNLGEVLLLILN